MLLRKRKQIFILLMGLMGGVFGGLSSLYAAMPVFDAQSIAQQMKIFSATSQLGETNREQLSLQQQDAESLPDNILEKYNTALTGSNAHMSTLLQAYYAALEQNNTDNNGQTTNDEVSDMEEYAHLVKTIDQQQLESNMAAVEAYKQLQEDLKANQERLQELNEVNANVVGTKQALQLANQISVVQSNIDGINIAMQILAHQVEANKNIAQGKREQAAILMAEKEAEAEDKDEEKTTDEEEKYSPAIDDPWSQAR